MESNAFSYQKAEPQGEFYIQMDERVWRVIHRLRHGKGPKFYGMRDGQAIRGDALKDSEVAKSWEDLPKACGAQESLWFQSRPLYSGSSFPKQNPILDQFAMEAEESQGHFVGFTWISEDNPSRYVSFHINGGRGDVRVTWNTGTGSPSRFIGALFALEGISHEARRRMHEVINLVGGYTGSVSKLEDSQVVEMLHKISWYIETLEFPAGNQESGQ